MRTSHILSLLVFSIKATDHQQQTIPRLSVVFAGREEDLAKAFNAKQKQVEVLSQEIEKLGLPFRDQPFVDQNLLRKIADKGVEIEKIRSEKLQLQFSIKQLSAHLEEIQEQIKICRAPLRGTLKQSTVEKHTKEEAQKTSKEEAANGVATTHASSSRSKHSAR
ncbi:hypothetical protein FA10DRAFT_261900 [Acaromyces ingoldii]|uniref:Uncharacterized protein n=1 Tax=Acaromyces ingoldii TaxID=215250 RepID=A0A316YI75_9BASI|nr:hypothetical protein FA10DRAFT_261900 [Acaromyces ingoldii]PWN88534.1 hypothetical protein FA10DRAFT_261900 [Acaromyces ingoldii]